MKMKIPLLLFFLLLASKTFAQQANEGQLKNIIPPSPTPFELTKYGNTEMLESKGLVSTSVDLYNYRAGKLQVPISMTYTGAGIKVDQLCSWTGINWNLRAGGVISRTVRDRTDESSIRKFYTSAQLNELLNTNEGIKQIAGMPTDGTDTEADIFSFNFAGYSGSFYLDENLQPQLASYDKELKIEFVTNPIQDNDNQQIVITDPNGVKYYFGGLYATERTRLDMSGSSFNTLQNPITAYYLTKISNPFLDEIYFSYQQESNDYNILLGTNESATKIYNDDVAGYPNYVENYSGISSSRTKTYNGKFLASISNNRTTEEIHFSSTEYGNEHFHRILNDIKVTRNNGNNVLEDFKFFRFHYIFQGNTTNSTRFFLEKVITHNKANQEESKYVFEYNTPTEVPNRLSFSKDMLGYYNGKINSTGLPRTYDDKFKTAIGGVVLADRSYNFSDAIKGSLSKITYPTGGSTLIEYEGIPEKALNRVVKNLKVYHDRSTLTPEAYPIPDTQLISNVYIGGTQNELIEQNQDVVVNVQATAQGSLNHHYKVIVTVKEVEDMSPIQVQSFNLEYGVYTYNKNFTFNFITGNMYKVTLELVVPYGTNSAPVDVNLDFNYSSGYTIVDGHGLRVKRIVNQAITNKREVKRYYYTKIVDINNLDNLRFKTDYYGVNLEYLRFTQYKMRLTSTYGTESPIPIDNRKFTLYSDTNRATKEDDQKVYDYITTSYGGDNFENGGVQKLFRYIPGQNPTSAFSYYPSIQSDNLIEYGSGSGENWDLYNGELMEELFFVNHNGLLKMNKKNISNFNYENSSYIRNYTIKTIFDNTVGYTYGTPSENLERIYHIYFGSYNTYKIKKQLVSTLNIDYLEPVPVTNLENANLYKHIKSVTEYNYSNGRVGLPISINTTSSEGEVQKTENEYSNATTHINNHQLSEVTRVSRFSDNNLLSTNNITYGNFGSKLLPKKFETSKSTGMLLENTNVQLYDSFGNVLELKQSNGIPITYIWGYNQTQPIAKIENATYAEVQQYEANLQTLSNGTDEVALLAALNVLRTNLPGAMVTTYTYKPLIGVSTITDAKGDQITYSYDSFNRLQFVKDKSGNILSENQYNYKQ